MTLLQWLEDYTIIHELGWLAVVWIAIVQPPLAVFWVLRKRQFRRAVASLVSPVAGIRHEIES
jgi:hypothetical protein